MGYCISYNPELEKKYPLRTKRKKKKWPWVMSLLAVLLVAVFATNSRQMVKQWLLPGDPQLTEEALTCFVQDVREGMPMKEAFTAFCVEIIESAELSK